ncbi:MAG: hypothetical protein HQ578_06850 [Chloroflexi bacterium]|nr:hypothetical protein [Chloroflexota bacterium]
MKRLYSRLTYYLAMMLVLWVICAEVMYRHGEMVWTQQQQANSLTRRADKGK